MRFQLARIIAFALILGFTVNGQTEVEPGTQGPSPCTLTTNPDITGVGVRIAFYFQGLITLLGPYVFHEQQIDGIFSNALFTSVALTISAFIYGRTPGGLSLLDGLVITFLVEIITIGASKHISNLLNGPGAKKTLLIAYILHLVGCLAYGLVVWTHVDSYATTPGCNLNSSVKFVLFGHSVGATSKGLRGFSIFLLAVLALDLPSLLYHLVFGKTDSERVASGINEVYSWLLTFALPASWVYGVITIEQIIQRNGVSNIAAQWTFGQTFALTLLIGPGIEFCAAGWTKVMKSL